MCLFLGEDLPAEQGCGHGRRVEAGRRLDRGRDEHPEREAQEGTDCSSHIHASISFGVKAQSNRNEPAM